MKLHLTPRDTFHARRRALHGAAALALVASGLVRAESCRATPANALGPL
jgi:hypothetical protein